MYSCGISFEEREYRLRCCEIRSTRTCYTWYFNAKDVVKLIVLFILGINVSYRYHIIYYGVFIPFRFLVCSITSHGSQVQHHIP